MVTRKRVDEQTVNAECGRVDKRRVSRSTGGVSPLAHIFVRLGEDPTYMIYFLSQANSLSKVHIAGNTVVAYCWCKSGTKPTHHHQF